MTMNVNEKQNSWRSFLEIAERYHWWFEARRKIVTYLFWRTYKNPLIPHILSVGISSGVELEYLSNFGLVQGIDIDPWAVKKAHEKGFITLEGDITRAPFEDASFDVIFAMDVLEHIPDHEKAYAEIVRILKPGGQVVVTVPAFRWLWSATDEEDGHVRRYSKKELKKLLTVHEMKVMKMSFYNFFLFPFIVLMRRAKKTSLASDLQLPTRFINTMLTIILQSEKYFLRWINFPFGASLIAICAKENIQEGGKTR